MLLSCDVFELIESQAPLTGWNVAMPAFRRVQTEYWRQELDTNWEYTMLIKMSVHVRGSQTKKALLLKKSEPKALSGVRMIVPKPPTEERALAVSLV